MCYKVAIHAIVCKGTKFREERRVKSKEITSALIFFIISAGHLSPSLFTLRFLLFPIQHHLLGENALQFLGRKA